jgi:hypothetical protein
MPELTADLVHSAIDRARDDVLEAAAKMIEARAKLYRGHARDESGLLGAKAEEADDIAAALRALRSDR